MFIWFECETENLKIGLETDTKPTVGDIIWINDKDYSVEKVIWCLENPPAQSGLLIQINQMKEQKMDAKDFFKKTKAICEYFTSKDYSCSCCPLDKFCDAGIFAINSEKVDSLIDIVKNFD